jgi:hypothetical protein
VVIGKALKAYPKINPGADEWLAFEALKAVKQQVLPLHSALRRKFKIEFWDRL